MEIITRKGKKHEEDNIYSVTMNDEPFSITKFCELLNKVALNEQKINGEKIKTWNRWFFKECVNEAIELAKKGIDFREWINDEKNLKEWCKKYCLDCSKVKNEM